MTIRTIEIVVRGYVAYLMFVTSGWFQTQISYPVSEWRQAYGLEFLFVGDSRAVLSKQVLEIILSTHRGPEGTSARILVRR